MNFLNPSMFLFLMIGFGGGLVAGIEITAEHYQLKIERQENEGHRRYQKLVERNQQLERDAIQHQDKIQTIFRDRKILIEKEVPYEVIISQDNGCVIPHRFVSLWNSANQSQIPTTASLLDESPSAVKLSDIETTKEREAEICHANTQQLIDLQAWVKNQLMGDSSP